MSIFKFEHPFRLIGQSASAYVTAVLNRQVERLIRQNKAGFRFSLLSEEPLSGFEQKLHHEQQNDPSPPEGADGDF